MTEIARDDAEQHPEEPAPVLDVYHACELEPHRRAFFRLHSDASRPRHIFGDLCHRYPASTRGRMLAAAQLSDIELQSRLASRKDVKQRKVIIDELGDVLLKRLATILQEPSPPILQSS